MNIQCPDFDAISYEKLNFPCGETHIKIKDPYKFNGLNIVIDFKYHGDNSLFELALLVDAIRRLCKSNLILNCYYFPGARQDRVCAFGEPLSCKVYADFINNLNFAKVCIFDPHSGVVAAVLNDCVVVDSTPFTKKAIDHFRPDLIVSPDSGAEKRAYSVAKLANVPWISAFKVRDLKTGKIIDYKLNLFGESQELFYGHRVLIVDDIISHGTTFKTLAAILKKELRCSKIGLCVSHHEGVAPTEKLKEAGIDIIYTTNSLGRVEHDERTKVIDIN